MIKIGLIGAGKMGISHLSILGANPEVEVAAVCDTNKLVTDFLSKYSGYPTYADHRKMLADAKLDAVVVAVPTKYHFDILNETIDAGYHVFGEKPFCLNAKQGKTILDKIVARPVVNQVGYHNKFIGTFQEVKRLLKEGVIGTPYHFLAESYGPVVTMKKKATWRSSSAEGGGCLLDYASHVIDLVNDLLSPIVSAQGTLLKPIFSESVEDSVYSVLKLESGLSGMLSVNWSDETYRKMSTSVTIFGDKGKIISDANELKVFLKDDTKQKGYSKGWNVKYITELTPNVDFYLRGEEYSAQLDYFVKAVQQKVPNTINNFKSAYLTDVAIETIKNDATRHNG